MGLTSSCLIQLGEKSFSTFSILSPRFWHEEDFLSEKMGGKSWGIRILELRGITRNS